MVEISKSGSGEGLSRVTGPGYSTARPTYSLGSGGVVLRHPLLYLRVTLMTRH